MENNKTETDINDIINDLPAYINLVIRIDSIKNMPEREKKIFEDFVNLLKDYHTGKYQERIGGFYLDVMSQVCKTTRIDIQPNFNSPNLDRFIKICEESLEK